MFDGRLAAALLAFCLHKMYAYTVFLQLGFMS